MQELAERLHKEKPDLYPDANHKPEIAIALTGFEALCGFKPYSEIAESLTRMLFRQFLFHFIYIIISFYRECTLYISILHSIA